MSIVQFTKNAQGIIVGSRLTIDGLPYEQVLAQCEQYIKDQYNYRDRVKFVIGDLLNCLHIRYQHGSWEQIIPDVQALYNGEQGIATLVNWASVCARVPVSIRTGLSFTHHAAIAYLTSFDCTQFLQFEPEYAVYCQRHAISPTDIRSLQCYLLALGENMTARELHNFKMALLAGKPSVKPEAKTDPVATLRGVHSILRETLSYTLNNSISAEIRLQKANEVLQSILDQKIDNIIKFKLGT